MRPGLFLASLSLVLALFAARGEEASVPAASAAAALPAATPPALQLVVELSDGSRIYGVPADDRLKMSTSYADLEIKLDLLRAVEFGRDADHVAQVSLRNGDLLNGRIAAREIAMKTIFGQVSIPMAQVRRFRVVLAAGGALPEGLVLHYTFNEDQGNKVTDASNSGNDGTLNGATYVKPAGNADGAMSFSGNRAAICIKNSESLRLQDFTIMVWIKRGDLSRISNSDSPNALFFGYGQSGYNMGMDNAGHLFVGKVGVNASFSTCRVTDNAFHHLAVSKKGNKVMFYLDGVPCPGDDFSGQFDFNTDVAVGARPDDNLDASFLGMIGGVMVFNRVLSDDDVKGVYDSEKDRPLFSAPASHAEPRARPQGAVDIED